MADRHVRNLRTDGMTIFEEYLSTTDCDRLREATASAELRPDGDRELLRQAPDADPTDDSASDAVDVAGLIADGTVRTVIEQAADTDSLTTAVRDPAQEAGSFHAHSDPQFLAVAYLDPVTELADGPFAYLAGSHRRSRLARVASRLVNRVARRPPTAPTVADDTTPIEPTGGAGTVVVADGRGYHRLPARASDGPRSIVAVAVTDE